MTRADCVGYHQEHLTLHLLSTFPSQHQLQATLSSPCNEVRARKANPIFLLQNIPRTRLEIKHPWSALQPEVSCPPSFIKSNILVLFLLKFCVCLSVYTICQFQKRGGATSRNLYCSPETLHQSIASRDHLRAKGKA
jgi:hypothetical protein